MFLLIATAIFSEENLGTKDHSIPFQGQTITPLTIHPEHHHINFEKAVRGGANVDKENIIHIYGQRGKQVNITYDVPHEGIAVKHINGENTVTLQDEPHDKDPDHGYYRKDIVISWNPSYEIHPGAKITVTAIYTD